VTVRILRGDVRDRLRDLPDESVHCVVTSPPYWGLRDYGHAGQIGLEESPDEFLAVMVDVFREVRRVLRADGTCWVNMGDTYATGTTSDRKPTARGKHGYWENPAVNKRVDGRAYGLKPKDVVGLPWMLAFALRSDGWWLRQDIIWHKPNPMPESVRDRCTKAHEYIFLLAKSERYYYDADAIAEPSVYGGEELGIMRGAKDRAGAMGREASGNELAAKQRRESKVRGEFNAKPGTPEGREPFRAITETRNKRSVWSITTNAFPEAHFATFPPDLPELCIKAGCPPGGVVLDPFGGAGTTGLVADRLQRDAILIELNPEYADMAERRIRGDAPLFAQVGS
jgi:DNA modification methylase